MSRITEELREWVSNHYSGWSSKQAEGYAIADRIDERVTELLREQDADLRAEFDAMNDGWVRLPVDADGEVIHVGDVMEWCDSGETLEVVGIGDDCLYYLDGEEVEWTAARNKRHHHAPTVEDVLLEMCLEIDRRCERGSIDYDRLFAEYAARLREMLAGDAE